MVEEQDVKQTNFIVGPFFIIIIITNMKYGINRKSF